MNEFELGGAYVDQEIFPACFNEMIASIQATVGEGASYYFEGWDDEEEKQKWVNVGICAGILWNQKGENYLGMDLRAKRDSLNAIKQWLNEGEEY